MSLYRSATSSWFQYFRRINRLVLFTLLWATLLFSLFRLAFVWTYGSPEVWHGEGLWDALYWGVRMDLRTLAIILALPWLFSLFYTLVSPRFYETLARFQQALMQWLLSAATALEVVNHFYFKNFQNHIDIFIFQIFDWDNAVAVFKSIFTDYPLIPALLLMLVWHWLYGKGLRWMWQRSEKKPSHEKSMRFKAVYTFASLLLLALLIRGSLGTFPLTLNRVAIAGDAFLTQSVANGPLAFSDAFIHWRHLQKMAPVSDDEALQAYITYFGHPPLDGRLDMNDLLEPPLTSSPQPHPNIVMVQMESLGGHLLDAHDTEHNNLLGRLEPHLQEDYFFNTFAPIAMGTLMTLEKITLNSGVDNVSKTPYRDTPYRFAVGRMMQKAGYETIFLTGGHKTWGQIDMLMSHQGFDHILGGDDIREVFADAKDDGTWGVFDQYLFRYIHHLLKHKGSKPLFIYAMPVTNHLPYMLPDDYQPLPVKLPDAWVPLLVDHDVAQGELILQSYQYSADVLGDFMTQLKADPTLAEQTVVGASGDHNMRDLITYVNEPGRQHRVPFYLYLPPRYAVNTVRDPQRIGSHNDIFTTIFRHALPDMPAYALGQDLVSPDFDKKRALGISTGYFLTAEGCGLVGEQHTSYYRCTGQPGRDVEAITTQPDAALLKANARYRAYYTLQRWQMYREVMAEKALPEHSQP